MNSAESSRSPNLGDILCLRSKMSLKLFIFYHSLSFFRDSSQSSSPCIEGTETGMDAGIDTGPVGNDPSPPDEFLMCLRASPRNPKMLRLIANAETARTNIVAGEKLTSPPVPRKEETTIAEIMNVGTVTAPERADDRAIFRRTIA